ncbi:MAG TPA: discoidin domain-containing protein, partial [Pyrinomonadaceae bacterium]|nr:discoidin domain-containing protein [Pyrinomonadaceae bacterium]
NSWENDGVPLVAPCPRPAHGPFWKATDVASGQIVAGFIHYWDPGIVCDERRTTEITGTVWFDLRQIFEKPPLPFASKATLQFKALKSDARDNDGRLIYTTCRDELQLPLEDWRKGLPPARLPKSGPLAPPAYIECRLSEACSIDVTSIVNNWIKGSEDRNGFAIVGPPEEVREKYPNNNALCTTRYGDFKLTVTYKYNKKEPVLVVPVPVPEPPNFLLVSPGRKNVALASNGGAATASSTYAGQDPRLANDGDRKGLNGGWSAAGAILPQWLQIDFKSKTIDEIDVFTTQDNLTSPSEPTESMTFSLYGLSGYDVQYWDGSSWVTVMPGGSVTGNNKVWRKFTFKNITTTKVRVLANASPHNWAHIMELEAWGK